MDFEEKGIELNKIRDDIARLRDALSIDSKLEKIKGLEDQTTVDGFWNDTKNSQTVLQNIKHLKREVEVYNRVYDEYLDKTALLELSEEENDKELFKELENGMISLNDKLERLYISTLLSDEYDENNAIVTIHPGAGGTESQDWAEMLYRMYLKWAARNECETELFDLQDGEEAGIKSVSFLIKGMNTYGYMKCEKGVHRLVRISPFDSNSRRHTSFASVEVMPELDDTIELNIRDEDLEVDTYRASGAGGQHVNKTESAIRIKHVPTGVVVTCQTERSQMQNREYAMKMLRAKVYQIELRNQKEKLEGIKGNVMDNAWGSQIRSYVFCPYTLVKDHRTNYEIGNIEAVMNGRIDEFMYEYLKYSKNNK